MILAEFKHPAPNSTIGENGTSEDARASGRIHLHYDYSGIGGLHNRVAKK